MTDTALVDVHDLRKVFSSGSGRRRKTTETPALDGITFALRQGEVLGIVGESGSGKTTLARCLLRLVVPDAGSITLDGEDLVQAPRSQLRELRRQFQLIYQDPYSSLNPRLTIGDALAEPALVHGLIEKPAAQTFVAELLNRVGLNPTFARRKPSQLSGGQRQRVAIARALAARPKAIIADEPVSALDVSIQAQILNLFEDVASDVGSSMIFIAHQLAVVSHISQRVIVMYLGRIVEEGPTTKVLTKPAHPYTRALLDAHPTTEVRSRDKRHTPIAGEASTTAPGGCPFRDRCPMRQQICDDLDPPLVRLADGHAARCHFAQ